MLCFHEILVTEATPETLAVATRIVNEANSAFPRVFPGERLWENSIVEESGDGLLVIGTFDGVPVATMTLLFEAGRAKITLFAVDQSGGRRGLGAASLRYAEAIATTRGLSSIWLEAVDSGTLIGYYLREGYSEDFRALMPVGKWHAREPFYLVTMSKSL